MYLVLPPWELNPNSINKITILFGVRRWGGNTEQTTFLKKNGPWDCKTTIDGFAVPRTKILLTYTGE